MPTPNYVFDQYVLDLAFESFDTASGRVYYRDCVLQSDMNEGEQGWIVVFPDGEHLHTYMNPLNNFEVWGGIETVN